MTDWDVKDLEYWDEKIREKVEEFGLSCYPQEFEICDHVGMLGYMAYSGMPSHYPHWSYGKSYEKLKTMYDYGVSGLPYEMVINSNPALAYLMRDNSLCLQVLTVAHVYGHNDFFKNNFTFKSTRAELTLNLFKIHAGRIRGYLEDPSIGVDKVEPILDAAHAVAIQCRRNLAIKKLSPEEERRQVLAAAQPTLDPFQSVHKRQVYTSPDLHKVPLSPEEDLLLFIRDYNLYLSEWEKDLLTIVHERERYFIPQIETKIMNEGWASYWHREIMNSLRLPQDLQLEFLVRHNQVVRPFPNGLNPYHLGLKIWDDIKRRHDEPTLEEVEKYGKPTKTGRQALFEAREIDRDVSFLRRFLTEELMREMDMFQYEPKGAELVISKVSDKNDWREIKETLLKNIGMGTIPVIKIEDADYNHTRTLYLKHDHEGRDLKLDYAERTLEFLWKLWRYEVILETTVNGKKALLSYSDKGFSTKPLK
ncbi:MAG: stage V sporulation protein R [Parcubacteria group bacterium Gr01-1014_29]|nr:MAG: stage V sporulation protein R [Parcubacteria group bacterium Gr01-1014_29]